MDQLEAALKKLRAHLSQAEIARRTGIAQSKISRWEAGDVPAGALDALKLVELAGGFDAHQVMDRPAELEVGHG